MAANLSFQFTYSSMVQSCPPFCLCHGRFSTLCACASTNSVEGIVSHFRPWAVGQNYFASWDPCGKYLVWGLFERHIGTSLPKKSSQAKTCPIPRKWVINDYPLLNCITAKIGNFYNSITIKMTSIIGKRTKNRI
jgi:hypothetical protein